MKRLPYSDLWKKVSSSPFRLRIALILGIAGIILIMLSDMLSDSREEETDKTDTVPGISSSQSVEDTKKALEKELTEMLGQVSGVGSCRVMVTLEGTEEYIYAEDVNAGGNGGRTETKTVFTETKGEKQALVRKTVRPQISGILVVCEGGGDARVNERVLKAVSAALGISSARICVEAMA